MPEVGVGSEQNNPCCENGSWSQLCSTLGNFGQISSVSGQALRQLPSVHSYMIYLQCSQFSLRLLFFKDRNIELSYRYRFFVSGISFFA